MLNPAAHIRTAALALGLALSTPLAAQDTDPKAALRARLERIEALRAQRPGDMLLVYFEAMTRAALGERAAALEALRRLKGRRLGLIPASDLGFEALAGDTEFEALRAELAAEEAVTPPAPVRVRLHDPKLIPEGIAYDATRQRHLLGSIAQRKIVAVDARGRVRDFSRSGDGLDAVLGLAVDARRGELFAVSTGAAPAGPGPGRGNAVFRYRLRDGRLLERSVVPEAMQLNDVAVGPDGTLWLSDSAAGRVFRRKPGEKNFSALVAVDALRGANGVAPSPDGGAYVTLSTGIARVTAEGQVARLAQPDSLVSGGIDGLYWYRGDLIGVQNSFNPGRVVRLHLAPDGQSISGLTVLQSHHHAEFAEPTTGVVVGQSFDLLANSFVGRLRPDGQLTDAASLRPTAIVRVPLD